MGRSLGHKMASGVIWATLDKFGNLGIQFIVNLVLARLLYPEEFGVVGILAIFIAVSNTLVEGGFGSALIQKKRPTQTDYSTILFWNIGLSTLLYLLLFAAAPAVGRYFAMPVLCDVLRGIGLSLIFTGITSVQSNRLQKRLEFNTLAATNIVSSVIAGCTAMLLAFRGWGVWSLVALQIMHPLARIFMLYFVSGWLPSLRFSVKSLRSLFGFGGYLLIANLLQETCKNIQGFIIGKRFSATQMGYFSQAYKLDNITSYSIPQVIVQVMFPVYSSIQDERQRLAKLLEMNVRVISFLVFPVLSLLILSSAPLIDLLYGAKWLPAAPYFRILCVGGMFVALQNVNFYAVASCGKSNVLFWWSFYKWGMLLVLLLLGSLVGMEGIMWAMVLSNCNIYVVNAALASRYVGLGFKRQLRVMSVITLLCASCLAVSLGLIEWCGLNWWCAALMFIVFYIALSFGVRLRAVGEIQEIITALRNRK